MNVDLVTSLTTFAASGVPGDSASARLAVPIGILVFFGSIFLLLRANLGTRRGYLVLATSFFGFMIIMSLFWTFGAPGTPQAVGPTHLPTQPSDAYEPTWTAFAQDSLVAERPDYAFVQDYPEGFSELPEELKGAAGTGTDNILGFFAENAPVSGFDENWEPTETLYAEAPNGYPVIAVTFAPPAEEAEEEGGEAAEGEGGEAAEGEGGEAAEGEGGEAAAEGEGGEAAEDEGGEAAEEEDAEPVTLFAFFDEGAPLFPGIVFIIIAVLGFILHAFMLNADERREQRDLAEVAPEQEKVPAGA